MFLCFIIIIIIIIILKKNFLNKRALPKNPTKTHVYTHVHTKIYIIYKIKTRSSFIINSEKTWAYHRLQARLVSSCIS